MSGQPPAPRLLAQVVAELLGLGIGIDDIRLVVHPRDEERAREKAKLLGVRVIVKERWGNPAVVVIDGGHGPPANLPHGVDRWRLQ